MAVAVVDILDEGESNPGVLVIELSEFYLWHRFLDAYGLYHPMFAGRIWICEYCFSFSVPSLSVVSTLEAALERLGSEAAPDAWETVEETCQKMADLISRPIFDSDDAFEKWRQSAEHPPDIGPTVLYDYYWEPRKLAFDEVTFRFKRDCPSCQSVTAGQEKG